MEVFFNENSIYERNHIDPEKIVEYLDDCVKTLDYYSINVYSDVVAFKSFFQDINDTQKLTLFTKILGRINNFKKNLNQQHYYYYFQHQNYGLSIEKDVSSTSLSDAVDRKLQGNDVIILNIPNSIYCYRNIVPIIKSPHNDVEGDELANIECFNTISGLTNYYLIEIKLKKFGTRDQIIKFKNNYISTISEFDYTNWTPRTFSSESVLNSNHSFPASNNVELSNFFASLKISVGNYHENVARYIELGSLVLNLHGYTRNPKISNKYNREIFEGGYGNKKLLISLDTENGLFEVIGSDGTHIGVYNYAGIYQKHYKSQKDIDSHSLKNLSRNLFLFD